VPFTLAHAVAARPLWRLTRGYLPISALVVGSMAPDFGHFLLLRPHGTLGHSVAGLFVFCLPLSLVVLGLWHAVVKRPLAGLLPHRWAHLAAAAERPFPVRGAAGGRVGAAVILGAMSHLAWDALTHVDGVVVTRLSLLRADLPLAGVPVYKALQYGCSVAGVAALAWMALSWARRQPRVEIALPPRRVRLAGLAFIALFTALTAMASGVRAVAELGTDQPRVLVVAVVVGSVTGAALAVTSYALANAPLLRSRVTS